MKQAMDGLQAVAASEGVQEVAVDIEGATAAEEVVVVEDMIEAMENGATVVEEETEVMAETGVMEAVAAVDTGAVDTAAAVVVAAAHTTAGIIGVAMVNALDLDPTEMDTTAMVSISSVHVYR